MAGLSVCKLDFVPSPYVEGTKNARDALLREEEPGWVKHFASYDLPVITTPPQTVEPVSEARSSSGLTIQLPKLIFATEQGVPMNLLLRRDQRSGLLGKVVFQLDVRAEISPQEMTNIQRYKLGATMLYTKNEMIDRGSGLLGLASRMAFHAMNISVTVNDLVQGKRIECKDILEMLAVEGQIREAALTFKQVLDAAAHFGGEEVVPL